MLKKIPFILFFFCLLSFGQEQAEPRSKEKTPLKKILINLEKEFEVRFSYAPELIAKYTCLPFSKEKTLDEKLEFLRKETNLLFEKIDKRYIIIKKKEPTTNHTVCGFLIDKSTGLPIEQATVFLENKAIGVSTDAKGFFELSGLQSNWTIRVNYLGYYSLKIPVYKLLHKECRTFVLTETNEELEEVLISDYLTQGMVKKNNGSIQVSPRKLGILPGLTEPDILQSIQLLPGIQSPNETASGLHIRGGTPDQNLILFDGIKMYQSGHFFGLISSFNPYVTQKIELFRSGTRAKYGDRIGGVLDINSGENIPESKIGFGINMTHADVYFKTPLLKNKVGVVFSARRSITDWIETITYKKFSESVFQNTRILDGINENVNSLDNVKNKFYFKDYNLKIIAQLSQKDKLIFSNLYNKNELEYAAENKKFREAIKDEIEIENKGFNLKWNRNWNLKLKQELAVLTSSYLLNYEGERRQTRRNEAESVFEEFVKYNKVHDFGINYNLSYQLSENSTWNNGYQFSKNKITYNFKNDRAPQNNSLDSDTDTNDTHAFYTEYQYTKDNNWHLSAGLRFNNFSAVGKTYAEPRIFVSKQLSDAWRVKLSGEIKNQVVSQIIEFRNNGLGLENNIWALASNEEIPLLKSGQVSGGFLFQKNGWNLDVEGYYKNINGLTLITNDLTIQAPQYVSGVSKITGLDFLLKKRMGNYRSWISYTFSKTAFKYRFLNEGKVFDGTYDIPHSLVWSHTLAVRDFEFSLGWKIRSGTPYTKALEDLALDQNNNLRIDYESDLNSNRLPVYQKFDFSSTYKFKFSKNGKTEGKIGVSLLNILNKKNILDRTYDLKIIRNSSGTEEQKLVETDKVAIGFTPNFVFRVSF